MKPFATLTAALAAIAIGACSVHQTDAPGLSGPSVLALSLSVVAVPDSISQNGSDQSTIRVTAIGPTGAPVAGLAVRLQTMQNNVIVDFGTLSSKNIVTGTAGTATVVFTSPPAPPTGSTVGTCQPSSISLPVVGNCVTIVATPTGTDFNSAQSTSVELRLVPPGIILPPVKTPKASFTFLPSSPQVGQSVVFDGSASCAEADASGNCVTTSAATIVSYSWNFGDGGSASGKNVTHTFNTAGSPVVTLTVTNSTGGAASTSQVVTVTSPAGPKADFLVSKFPGGSLEVNFDASTSTAAPGHTIVQYSWNFGDADTAQPHSGQIVNHTFPAPGTYNVTLFVLDDTGQRDFATKSVTVP